MVNWWYALSSVCGSMYSIGSLSWNVYVSVFGGIWYCAFCIVFHPSV